jgi:hypothetical protein
MNVGIWRSVSRSTMLGGLAAALMLSAVAGVVTAAPARADDWRRGDEREEWRHREEWRERHRDEARWWYERGYYGPYGAPPPPAYVEAPPPVVYTPPPPAGFNLVFPIEIR